MSIRLTHVAAEVLRKGDPDVRLTHVAAEVLRKGDPDVRLTHVAAEVLRENKTTVQLNKLSITSTAKGLTAKGIGTVSIGLKKLNVLIEAKTLDVHVVAGVALHNFSMKLRMLRDNVDVGTIPSITDDDLIDEPVIKEKGWPETLNEIYIQFAERIGVYFSKVRITQEALEVLRVGYPYARITQEAIEVLRVGVPSLRITQEVLEVLRESGTGDSSSSALPPGDSSSSALPPGDSSSSASYECSGFWNLDKCEGGEALASSEYGGGYEARLAFDNSESTRWAASGKTGWIQYDFGEGKAYTIGKVRILGGVISGLSTVGDFTIEGRVSDDSSSGAWDLLYSGTHPTDTNWHEYIFENYTAYRFIRVSVDSDWDDASIYEIEMMECLQDSSAVCWQYSNDRCVSGTALAESEYSGSYVDDNAFDGNLSSRWSSASGHKDSWIQYDFGVGVSYKIRLVRIKGYQDGGNSGVGSFTIEGRISDDSSSGAWNLLFSGVHPPDENWHDYEFNNDVAYRVIRISMTSERNEASIYEIEMKECAEDSSFA